MMYEVAASRVERIEQRCSMFIRKWLALPRQLNDSALYGKGSQLELPLNILFRRIQGWQGEDCNDAEVL